MSLAASSALFLAACATAPSGSTAAKPPEVAPPAVAPTVAATAAAAAATARPKPAGVASGQEALKELRATRQGYEEAQKAYAAGDRARALEIMNGTYLDHFERVEPWMDEKFGRDYRQQVEATISRDLRRKLRDDLNADVAAQFPVAFTALQEAESRVAALP